MDTLQGQDVLCDLARLIGQASGHKTSRILVSGKLRAWLERQAAQTSYAPLCAAAGTALIKLRQGSTMDAAEVASPSEAEDGLAMLRNLRGVLLQDNNDVAVADAVEGLAYLSRGTDVAETLSKDTPLLQALFSKVPQKHSGSQPTTAPQATLMFGIASIILNSVAYRPRLTGEQAQIEKIRRMANAGVASSKLEEPELPPSSDDAHVKARGERLLAAGAVDALARSVRMSESKTLRLSVGRALLHLIENKDNRGRVLQSGGAKALLIIIADLLPSGNQAPDNTALEPIQALAKLAITSSPIQVFGASGSLLDAVRPFAVLLTHAESTYLQIFESMMALTNLSSHGTEAAGRIAGQDQLLSRVEMLLLDDHTLTRRAATELLCNLITNSEKVFKRYAGTDASKTRLQVIVALTDVDDVPTQLAASGALAAITMSFRACQVLADLQLERHRVLPVLVSLIDPAQGDADAPQAAHPGLVHRVVLCVRNLFEGIQEPKLRKQIAQEGEDAGLVLALVRVLKNATSDTSLRPAMEPTAEILRTLMALGVAITT
jgi:hypothetical protein